ncbi:MAG: phosphotransferase [Leptolyngbyaceae bacterium]|nr:phosphotransferase [Leptolyngbyaceae bacterium]
MSNFIVQIYKNANSSKAPNIHLPPDLPQQDLINPQLIHTAKELFQSSGVITICNLFPKVLITKLYRAFLKDYQSYFEDKEYANALDVGNRRKMLTVDIQGEFNTPDLYGNPFLMGLMREVLGSGFLMGSFGAVIALPGAKEQHIHRDHPPLFEDETLDLDLPSFAVTVVIPLVNLTPKTGSTQVWKGSHRVSPSQGFSHRDAFVPFIDIGSCYLMDYQLLHGGTANFSTLVRPILYLIYYRSWFRESVNYEKQVRLSLSRSEYGKVPAHYRFLFKQIRESFITHSEITQSEIGLFTDKLVKPRLFHQLTSAQQVEILQELASELLSQYGLDKTRIELISHGDNTVFAISVSKDNLPTHFRSASLNNIFYYSDRFILKIHRSHYLSSLEIESELSWLQQLCHDWDLPVPDPIPTLEGPLWVTMRSPFLDADRVCSLTRWLKGRSLTQKRRDKLLTPQDMQHIGRLMGTLHHHAAAQNFPLEFTRPHWNWDGLLGSKAGYSDDGDRIWSLLPQTYHNFFQSVSKQVQDAMADLGQETDQYGLIHGDFWLGNLLHEGEHIFPIDFSDCGFSYWGYEVARFMGDFLSGQNSFAYLNYLLEGYTQIYPFPDIQLSYLPLFSATQHISFALWRINRAQDHPQFRSALDDELQETVVIVESLLGNSSGLC